MNRYNLFIRIINEYNLFETVIYDILFRFRILQFKNMQEKQIFLN